MELKDLLLSADPVAVLREMEQDGYLRELEPALADLRMDIPKGWHHKDNLEHSIRVLGRAIERESNGPDLILRTAALFHDIGKPATRKFEKNSKVTFWNHAEVGAKKLDRGILSIHGYSKEDRSAVSHIVAHHMRAYGFGDVSWSDSAVRRLATDVGSEKALDRLIIVFYSDLTSRNKRKVRRIEDGIKRLEESLDRVRELDARKSLRPALDGYELMEMTGLSQGRELGEMMKFLNQDGNIELDRDESLDLLKKKFPTYF